MMVFLFIAISFMIEINRDKENAKNIIISHKKLQLLLNKTLYKEFKDDFLKWNSEITKDNTIRFYSPKVLFKGGVSKVSKTFKKILDDFFPRYIAILTSDKYYNFIDEVKIEGHTSSGWDNITSLKKIYIKNMELSQKRAFNVLNYCYTINNSIININLKWLENNLRANGMSFSKPIYDRNGQENTEKEKRVEFRATIKLNI